MEIAAAIAAPVAESLLDHVKKELNFIVSSSNYVTKMRKMVTELYGAEDDVRDKQNRNNGKGLVVPSHVDIWLRDVDNLRSREGAIPSGDVGCFNIKMRYKIGKQCLAILSDIDLLMQQRVKMVWSDERVSLAMVTSSKPSTVNNYDENEEQIESRAFIFCEALKLLEQDNNKAQKLALCGMAGVGKTTMMKQLKKAADKRKMFNWIVRVDVGLHPNPVMVQQAVADYLGEPLHETNKNIRAGLLQKRFENISEDGKKKILVILDDIWEKFNIEDIGLMSPLPNGFKLLLTSRVKDVCTQMGVEDSSIFNIDILKEPEDKNLFWETTGLGSVSDVEHEVHQIGEDIIKWCGGLPIAINTIASTLKHKKKYHAWKNALSYIQNEDFSFFHIKERDNRVLINIFEYSYENLEKDDLKATFLLSGLFPEDYDIRIEDLVMYVWGLKFFKNVHDIETTRCRVNTYVDELIDSNLLIRSDHEGCVKMHDLVRDFVSSSFSKVKQASIVKHNNNNVSRKLKTGEFYERILLKCTDLYDFPVDFNQPNLLLLKLMDGDNLKFPEDFYARMKKLEVVAYDNIYHPLLPQYSTNLQALVLRSCSLVDGDISFLGDLVNLEVLSLVHCSINKLPSKIGNLKRLKLLDLRGRDTIYIDSGVLQNLVELEELYLGPVCWTDASLDELKIILNKLHALEVDLYTNYKAHVKRLSLEKLERFRICMGCHFVEPLSEVELVHRQSIDINGDLFENTLKLVTSNSELLECTLNELFRKTNILYLEVNGIKHLETIATHPPQDSFCNLKALYIFGCANLEYLFTTSIAKGLMKLESLKIGSCPILKSVVNANNNEVSEITFHKLKIVRLENLPELVSLFDTVILMKLPRLVELHLDNCDSIVNLFPSNPIRLLGNLEELEVRNCDSIEVLFNIDLGKIEQRSSSSSSLRGITVSGLENLTELLRIKCVKNNHSGLIINDLQAMEYIDIRYCARYRNIVTPTTVCLDMRALKDVKISWCGQSSERVNELVEDRQEKEINTLSNEKEMTLKVDDDNKSIIAFPSYHIWCCGGYGMRKNESFKNIQEQEIATMSKVETSKVGDNVSLLSFTSHHITPNFNNLRKIVIKSFHGLEVVFEIGNPTNRDPSIPTQQQQPFLLHPYLEYLEIMSIDTLSHVWKCSNWNKFFILQKNQQQSSLQNLTTISLSLCNNIKYLFSPFIVKLLSNLKEVKVDHCEGLEEVISNRDDEAEIMAASTSADTTTTLFPHLEILELSDLYSLKQIGSGFSLKLPNLRTLNIRGCGSLESVFTLSTCESLKKLEMLTIKDCGEMKVIVKEAHGEHTTEDVVFSHLKLIELSNLPNLEGFLLGMNDDFQFPLLDDLRINDCPQMMSFISGGSTAPRLKYIQTGLGKYNLEDDLNFHVTPMLHPSTPTSSLDDISSRPSLLAASFHNLMEINISRSKLKTIVPSNKLQQLQQLETIHLDKCDNVEVVFEVAMEVRNNESQTVVKFPKLREVVLRYLHNLKYIWTSNKWRKLELPSLTILSLYFCDSLEHVFTCSMGSSLVQLQTLHIRGCNNMKVVVKGEEDNDAKVSEIMFPCLKAIRLYELSSLEGFCLGKVDFTLPSLDTLIIHRCPEIRVFTKGLSVSPKLQISLSGYSHLHVGKDINTFILTKKQEGFRF